MILFQDSCFSYCDACGEAIRAERASRGERDTPHRRRVGAQDQPLYCGHCRDFLGNAITDRGRVALRDQITDHVTDQQWELIAFYQITFRVGDYVVYHRARAGNPRAHLGIRPWFFEPSNWGGGDVFSIGYSTPQEAAAAAREWEEMHPTDR